jgi:hypothetical protein
VVKLRELSADEQARDLYERREKARRDKVMWDKWTIKQSKLEIAKNLLGMNMSIDQIATATILIVDEIERGA